MKKTALLFSFIFVFYSQTIIIADETEQLQKLVKLIHIDGIKTFSDLENFPYGRLNFIASKLKHLLRPSENPYSNYAVLQQQNLLETCLLFKDKVLEEISQRKSPFSCDNTKKKVQFHWNTKSESNTLSIYSESSNLTISSIAKKIGINTVQSIDDLKHISLGELTGLKNVLETYIKRDNHLLKAHALEKKDQECLESSLIFYENLLPQVTSELNKQKELMPRSNSDGSSSEEEEEEEEEEELEEEPSFREQLNNYCKKKEINKVISFLNLATIKSIEDLSHATNEDLESANAFFMKKIEQLEKCTRMEQNTPKQDNVKKLTNYKNFLETLSNEKNRRTAAQTKAQSEASDKSKDLIKNASEFDDSENLTTRSLNSLEFDDESKEWTTHESESDNESIDR